MEQYRIKYTNRDNLVSKIENTIYGKNSSPISGPESEIVYQAAIDTTGYNRLTNEVRQKTIGLPAYNAKMELITNDETPVSYTIAFLGEIEIVEDTTLTSEILIKRIK